MSDGRITIDIEIDGKKVKAAVKDVKELEQVSKSSSKSVTTASDSLGKMNEKYEGAFKDSNGRWRAANGRFLTMSEKAEMLGDDITKVDHSMGKATKSTKSFVTALIAVKVAGAVFNALKSSMDGAIARFDTFEKFPKVMKALGFGAEESKDAIDQLSGAIDGLPTTLDEIVASTQKFVGINGSLTRSTSIAEGLNNAFLASGSSSADAARGAEQYAQMLQNGAVDMQSWKSINETMGTSLNYVAKEMIGTEASSMDLYNAIKGGNIAFRDFEDALIDAGTGTGDLAKLAKENSKGIATSFGNLKNSTVKGLANILESVDKVVKKTSGKNIAENLDAMKVVVNKTFKVVGGTIEAAIPLVELLADGFKLLYTTGKVLSPVLIGVGTAFAAYKVITTINDSMQKYNQMSELAIASGKALTISTKAKTTATILDTGATEAQAIAEAANNGTLVIGAALVDVFTGKIKATVVAKAAWTTATGALSGALTFLATNPIGMAVAAIGVLVGAGAALYKWFGRSSGAAEEMADKVEESRNQVDELTKSVKNASNARKEEIDYSKKQVDAYKGVADAVINLSRQENLSTRDKAELTSGIDDLNREFANLNLSYDENTGKLNLNRDAIMGIIEQYSNLGSAATITDEIKNNEDEARAIKEQLMEVQKQQNQLYEDSTVPRYKIKKAEEELQAQEAELIEAQRLNAEEYKFLQEEKLLAYEAAAAAEAEVIANQKITYETLSESQQQTVENMKSTWQSYADAATDMFSKLSDEQTLTVAEMQANLDENQRVIGQWGENIAALTSRGVDEGLLRTLQEAGPASAGYVAALVNASDAELEGLNTSFKAGGDTATQALKDAFGLGAQEIPKEVMNMVTSAKTTLDSEIKAANFGELGKNISKGAAQGVEQGTPEVEKANEQMGKKGADAFKKATDQHSPSRLYHKFGGFIVEGLVNGLKAKESQPADALRHLSTRMKAMMMPLPNDMMRIGTNASYGLAAGINAGAGAAIYAAQSLAARVSATMKNALKINSPSRVMRDEIGRYIPQGLAEGIEKDSSIAINALRSLGSNLVGSISPETALGISGMSFASTAGQIINNSNSAPVTIDNRGMLEGAVFHVREEADIPKLVKAIDDYQESKNSNRYPGRR